ncbi:septum formation protein [Halobacillus dabanensis]|uniref:dTTP/UTP pyrophosphatase n=1 Tax=Halobacillus dabanensis TaxID=240302 RepID=A0A1I3P4G8_HALDA|nr:Maf family protein [Halobacillus dabanensis]SFJ16230.1 septum formation protein [Halobacillus dabanensis]
MKQLILGSQSPRRKELLDLAGYTFEVRPSSAEEIIEEGMSPEGAVLHLSRLKAEAVTITADEVLLTSDTVVVLDGKILGKPEDVPEAKDYLSRLSGQVHQVYTGVCIRTEEESQTFYVTTDVHFYPLKEKEIETYIQTGEVWDKAGAYGIQGRGALFVEKIHGDYYSVVGLPISRLSRELSQWGIYSD